MDPRGLDQSLGTEAVRRLMARPIQDRFAQAGRVQERAGLERPVPFPRQGTPVPGAAPSGEDRSLRSLPPEPPEMPAETIRAEDDAQDDARPAATHPDDAQGSDLARLKVEVMLMKAALQAERRESENLRACLGLDAAEEQLGAEARAVRLRWAALVDRLIHAPRPD